MAITGSTKISGYLSKFIMQNTKLIDYFFVEYLSDDDTKQFHIMDNLAQYHERFLRPIVKTVTFTPEEYRKYRFNPWRLSNDLYGTTELWFMILHINEMYSANEFDKRVIKIYDKDMLLNKLNEIVNVYNESLDANRRDILSTKKDIEEGIDGMWD